MTLMVFMVLIGRSKFGQNNRISLVEGLPDVMNLEVGDYVEFHVINGELIIRKETKKYSGFDFEGEEIHDKMLELEKSKVEELEDSNLDPEEIEERARQNYLKDKAARTKKNNM